MPDGADFLGTGRDEPDFLLGQVAIEPLGDPPANPRRLVGGEVVVVDRVVARPAALPAESAGVIVSSSPNLSHEPISSPALRASNSLVDAEPALHVRVFLGLGFLVLGAPPKAAEQPSGSPRLPATLRCLDHLGLSARVAGAGQRGVIV